MRIQLTIFLFLISYFANAQKYETLTVIETAKSYLRDAVGPDLINYFELDSNSYYEYKNFWGKKSWEEILHGKMTKGKFVNGHDIRFTLKHPDFLFALKSYRNVYVKLDSVLNLVDKIDLDRIPEFLLTMSSSNWLNNAQVDSVAKSQNLKKSLIPLKSTLNYDFEQKKYYWTVFNTIYAEKCFSDCEILDIDPITGDILKHEEARLHVMHCH